MAVCPGLAHWTPARDGGLARVRVPGGWLTGAQARGLARIATRLGNGAIEITNRANVQIRGLGAHRTNAFVAALDALGLAARPLAGDRRRNILAGPLRGRAPGETRDMEDVRAALDAALQASPALGSLSPKAAIALDGGCGDNTLDAGHDIGLLAENAAVLRLTLANRDTALGLAPADAPALVLALLETLARHGDDARMGAMLAGRAPAAFARAVAEEQGLAWRALPPREGQTPARAWRGRIALSGGAFALGLGVPLGRPAPAVLEALADLAEARGDGLVRLSRDKGLVLAGLDAANLAGIEAEAGALGLAFQARAGRVVACSGAGACARANAPVREDGARLERLLGADLSGTAHVSGCARGCAHPGPADLLLLARPDGAGYDLHANAAAGAPGPALARALDPAEAAARIADGTKRPLAPARTAGQKAG